MVLNLSLTNLNQLIDVNLFLKELQMPGINYQMKWFYVTK